LEGEGSKLADLSIEYDDELLLVYQKEGASLPLPPFAATQTRLKVQKGYIHYNDQFGRLLGTAAALPFAAHLHACLLSRQFCLAYRLSSSAGVEFDLRSRVGVQESAHKRQIH